MRKVSSKLLHSNKGETLLEGIASIMLFSILMVLMASIISFSVKLNANTNASANALQKEINIINEDSISYITGSEIQFEYTIEGKPLMNSQNIAVTDNTASNSLFAFRPID